MGLQALGLKIGPTISITGGTAQTFGPDGSGISNGGLVVIDVNETDIRSQDLISFRSTRATLQKDGSYSKDRRSVRITSPDLLSDGKQDMPYLEITYFGSPLNNAVKVPRLIEMGVQALKSADTQSFWLTGALS